jgi:hypothetical protein
MRRLNAANSIGFILTLPYNNHNTGTTHTVAWFGREVAGSYAGQYNVFGGKEEPEDYDPATGLFCWVLAAKLNFFKNSK